MASGTGTQQKASGHDPAGTFRAAIQLITPIWAAAQKAASLRTGFEFSGCSFQESVTIDLLNAVADIGKAVHDDRLLGSANEATRLAFAILQECSPETLFEPLETAPNPPAGRDENGARLLAFVAGCRQLRDSNPKFEFWEPTSLTVLKFYDREQGTTYAQPTANFFAEYFRALKNSPKLQTALVLDEYLGHLEEFAGSARTHASESNRSDVDCPECLKAYEVLGLVPGAPLSEIKTAHRDLAKVWHPDRFNSGNPRLLARAEKAFKEVQAAYDHLASHASEPATEPTPGAASEPTSIVKSEPATASVRRTVAAKPPARPASPAKPPAQRAAPIESAGSPGRQYTKVVPRTTRRSPANSWLMGLVVLVVGAGLLGWAYQSGVFDKFRPTQVEHQPAAPDQADSAGNAPTNQTPSNQAPLNQTASNQTSQDTSAPAAPVAVPSATTATSIPGQPAPEQTVMPKTQAKTMAVTRTQPAGKFHTATNGDAASTQFMRARPVSLRPELQASAAAAPTPTTITPVSAIPPSLSGNWHGEYTDYDTGQVTKVKLQIVSGDDGTLSGTLSFNPIANGSGSCALTGVYNPQSKFLLMNVANCGGGAPGHLEGKIGFSSVSLTDRQAFGVGSAHNGLLNISRER